MSPDTDRTMRLESVGIGLAHAISPAAAKYCRGQRRSGTEAHRAHAAPAASALDAGTDLMAGSISIGSHDGDSPGAPRPWDR
jgi:hypothetical protein